MNKMRSHLDIVINSKCRFCSDPPAAVYHFDKGCMCYPDDSYQILCLHHLMRSEPLGKMVEVFVFEIEKPWWYNTDVGR